MAGIEDLLHAMEMFHHELTEHRLSLEPGCDCSNVGSCGLIILSLITLTFFWGGNADRQSWLSSISLAQKVLQKNTFMSAGNFNSLTAVSILRGWLSFSLSAGMFSLRRGPMMFQTLISYPFCLLLSLNIFRQNSKSPVLLIDFTLLKIR